MATKKKKSNEKTDKPVKKSGEDITSSETKKKVLDAVAGQQAWERGDSVECAADESEKPTAKLHEGWQS